MPSKLEIQMKSLKRQLDKVAYYKQVKAVLKQAEASTPECDDSVSVEVRAELNTFIDKMISMLENPEEEVKPQNFFTGEEPIQPASTGDVITKVVIPKQDKIQFAIANKHLAGKTVIVSTKDGEVEAEVKSLDCPNVIVHTVTGFTAAIPIEKIRLKEEK